ncbi:hypothetical protein GCM10022216_16810 [Sphingobacterium kyonggiense]|uniref:HTH araC/xylS-type domain-containing protein n=1 Tax=Sphingobacterium kyonggiense TaxID=714075 RepID=A0ABP7YP07_9SPHI
MGFNEIVTCFISGAILLLSFLFLTNPLKVNVKGDLYFGIFLLLWASFWLDGLIFPGEIPTYVYYPIRLLQFFCALTFYTSVVFYTNPGYKFGNKDSWILILPVIFIVILSLKSELNPKIFNCLYLIVFLGQALFYTVLSYFRIVRHQKQIEVFSANTEPINLNWIKYIIYCFMGSSILLIILNLIETVQSLNLYINLYFLAVIYFVSYYGIRQTEIYPKELNVSTDLEPEGTLVPERNALMSNSELEKNKEQLELMMNDEKPYLDPELNLPKLSEMLGISSHQLSYVINQGYGMNFFNYVNGYRIAKAKDLLKDKNYDHLTILAIAYESGFNSKTAFNNTFKKITSITPSTFKNT